MAYNLQGCGLAGGFGMLSAHRFTDGTNKWNGLSIFCHNATHYWLLKSVLGQDPTFDQYVKVALKYAENLKSMIRKGTRLKSAAELARLPADTILIYSEDGLGACHSGNQEEGVHPGSHDGELASQSIMSADFRRGRPCFWSCGEATRRNANRSAGPYSMQQSFSHPSCAMMEVSPSSVYLFE